jgi:DNA gyrase subunit A
MKRVSLKSWSVQKRGGAGIVLLPVDERTGPVVSLQSIEASEKLVASGSLGTAELLAPNTVPAMARSSKGRVVLQVKKGETAISLGRLGQDD